MDRKKLYKIKLKIKYDKATKEEIEDVLKIINEKYKKVFKNLAESDDD
jgi:hypothetical protein